MNLSNKLFRGCGEDQDFCEYDPNYPDINIIKNVLRYLNIYLYCYPRNNYSCLIWCTPYEKKHLADILV